MKQVRLFSLLLTLCVIGSVLPCSALAAPMEMPTPIWTSGDPLIPAIKTYEDTLTDVTDAWCADAVKTVYEAGLMEGKTSTRFDISSPLTNAQIVVIAARLHSLLRDGDGTFPPPSEGESWYRPALNYLMAESETPASLVEKLSVRTDDSLAYEPCSRKNFVQVIASVQIKEAYPREVLNPTVVPPDIRDEAVVAFYQAGILTGSDLYGTFGESELLTRGAAATILARYVAPLQRERFSLLPFDLCRDVLGVEPDTVLLTVNGEEIPAALFAEQLCTSLYQWEGNVKNAKRDAIQFWCWYQGPFRVLAGELDIFISPEEQEAIRLEAEEKDGYLGLPAAYWQFRSEGNSLNLKMKQLYWEEDWKLGESYYHNDLEDVSEAMTENAVPAPALEAMDLSAVYQRLMKSPFVRWQFQN